MVKTNYQHAKINLPQKYLLYIGRISEGKGCKLLLEYFKKYLKVHDKDLHLVMIGTVEQPIKGDNILILENISDEEKFYALKHSTIFIMPSFYESLNMACLEAWLFKKPVLVNGQCDVLKDHCINSHGGLYFQNFYDFTECLDLILGDKELSSKLGEPPCLFYLSLNLCED